MTIDPLSAVHAKSLYDQAATLAKFGAWECALPGNRLSWTEGVYEIFGLPAGSALHRPTTVALYHDDSRGEMERLRMAALAGSGGFALDARIAPSNGKERWIRLLATVSFAQGRPARLFGSKQDITHEKQLWDRLKLQANSDPLTGLANRRAFEARCDDLRRRAPVQNATCILAIIDLDHFKAINDRFGHAAGDECLRQTAMRLERIFNDAVLIARLGGDEFVVLLHLPEARPKAAAIFNDALRVLAMPVSWRGEMIALSTSIGLAILRDAHHGDPSELFREADSALYVAKAAGRARVRAFTGRVEDRPIATPGLPVAPSMLRFA